VYSVDTQLKSVVTT